MTPLGLEGRAMVARPRTAPVKRGGPKRAPRAPEHALETQYTMQALHLTHARLERESAAYIAAREAVGPKLQYAEPSVDPVDSLMGALAGFCARRHRGDAPSSGVAPASPSTGRFRPARKGPRPGSSPPQSPQPASSLGERGVFSRGWGVAPPPRHAVPLAGSRPRSARFCVSASAPRLQSGAAQVRRPMSAAAAHPAFRAALRRPTSATPTEIGRASCRERV